MAFICALLTVETDLLQCENIPSLAPQKENVRRNSKCRMNIQSYCQKKFLHQVEEVKCHPKQCIMGCFWSKIGWMTHLFFSFQEKCLQNKTNIPKWTMCNFSGHMTSLHNIYILSMLEGNYMYNIYIQITWSQETNVRDVQWLHTHSSWVRFRVVYILVFGGITLKSGLLHRTCCLCGQLKNRGNAWQL